MDLKADVVIVGGGLAGCLTALQFSHVQPELTVMLLEESEQLGGHHTWSFHESDLGPNSLTWMQPLISKSWEQTDVQFPRVQRTMPGRYHSIRSDALSKHVTEKMALNGLSKVILKAKATRLSESHVELSNGDVVSSRCVIDARGVSAESSDGPHGYQKFIGQDFVFEQPHGVTAPLIMDASCPQLDGFRFFYLLPFSENRLMVEETYYSDNPELNTERIQRSLRSYVERRGWKILSIEREERGVLPIPFTSEYILSSVGGEPLPIGMRGGYFHATTGYSTPDAIRVAEYLGAMKDVTTQSARDGILKFRRSWLSRQQFYRLLNRLLFYAAEPSLRYTVLQRFYEQPQDLIERFYAGKSTWSDRLRMLSGRPPVPLERAVRSFSERAVPSWAGRSPSTDSPNNSPMGRSGT